MCARRAKDGASNGLHVHTEKHTFSSWKERQQHLLAALRVEFPTFPHAETHISSPH